MAIVFISPKEKQKMFILAIAVFFVLLLIGVSLVVFFAKPKKTPVETVFKAPDIKINFNVLTSEKVNNLNPLPETEKEFNYTAKTESGKDRSGRIAASTEEKAAQILTAMGLQDIMLEEMICTRDNPFSPYYPVGR